jgi:hypothetical protein
MAVILIFYLSYFLAKIRRFYPQFPLRNQKIYHTVEAIQKELDQVFKDFQSRGSKASQELERLWEVMTVLLPQIKYFIETGFVANKKIIHLKISELYSIVRGKAGKKTEFGIKWGINRMGGGFVSGFVMESCKHASDIKFCHQAVLEHVKTFWAAPETYGFDRGGYSKGNIKKMKKLGIKHVGIAPKGKADWEISKSKQKVVKSERAQVNKPGARSITAMENYGHRSILGFNLTKLMKENQNLLLENM